MVTIVHSKKKRPLQPVTDKNGGCIGGEVRHSWECAHTEGSRCVINLAQQNSVSCYLVSARYREQALLFLNG